jgi:hypothetical protein
MLATATFVMGLIIGALLGAIGVAVWFFRELAQD